MELTLNLVWLAIALSSFAVVLPAAVAARDRRGRARARFLISGGVALLCVLALLFPIISVSDDLSVDRDVTEDSNMLRRTIAAVGHHYELPLQKQFGQFILAFITLLLAAILTAIARVEPLRTPSYSLILSRYSDPRAPPRR